MFGRALCLEERFGCVVQMGQCVAKEVWWEGLMFGRRFSIWVKRLVWVCVCAHPCRTSRPLHVLV